jgi:hypothetical protein
MTSSKTFQDEVVDWLDKHPMDNDGVEQKIAKINAYLNRIVTKEWTNTSGQKTFDRIEIKHAPPKNDGFYDYRLSIASGSNTFELKERSKGAQWYFCFKMLTEAKVSRLKQGVVFLLDEPASNLHVYNQNKVYEAIVELAERGKVYFMYTTHSPALTGLSEAEMDVMYLVHNKFRDAKDEDSSGKITARPIKKITPSLLKRGGWEYGHALAPLLHNALISDVSSPKDKKNRIQFLYDKARKIVNEFKTSHPGSVQWKHVKGVLDIIKFFQ